MPRMGLAAKKTMAESYFLTKVKVLRESHTKPMTTSKFIIKTHVTSYEGKTKEYDKRSQQGTGID